jgi:hypothetical protein
MVDTEFGGKRLDQIEVARGGKSSTFTIANQASRYQDAKHEFITGDTGACRGHVETSSL